MAGFAYRLASRRSAGAKITSSALDQKRVKPHHFRVPSLPAHLRQRFKNDRFPNRHDEKRPRINDQINSAMVLLVNDGQEPRKVSIEDALAEAKAQELDLIEVSPKAVPPVVKIGEFGHYLYQLQKRERKQKSGSKQVEVKMLRFGFRTDKHDIDRLIERAKEFMAERDLVKFSVRLRGRELANKDYAIDKLKGVLVALAEVAEVEQEIRRQGDQFTAILRPKKS